MALFIAQTNSRNAASSTGLSIQTTMCPAVIEGQSRGATAKAMNIAAT